MNCNDKLTKFRAFLMANSSSIPEKVQEHLMGILAKVENHEPTDAHAVIESIETPNNMVRAMLKLEWWSTDAQELPALLNRYLDTFGADELATVIKNEMDLSNAGKVLSLNEYFSTLKDLDRPEARQTMLILLQDDDNPISFSSRIKYVGYLVGTETLAERQVWPLISQWKKHINADDPDSELIKKAMLYATSWPNESRAQMFTRLLFGQQPFDQLTAQAKSIKNPGNGIMSINPGMLATICQQIENQPNSAVIANQAALTQLSKVGAFESNPPDRAKMFAAVWPVLERSLPSLIEQSNGDTAETRSIYRSYLAISHVILKYHDDPPAQILHAVQGYLKAVSGFPKDDALGKEINEYVTEINELLAKAKGG